MLVFLSFYCRAQAHATAVKTKLRPIQLRSRLNLARLDSTEGRAISAADLRALVGESERLGLRFEAVRGALLAAEADLRRNDRARAREAGRRQAGRGAPRPQVLSAPQQAPS